MSNDSVSKISGLLKYVYAENDDQKPKKKKRFNKIKDLIGSIKGVSLEDPPKVK